MLSDLCFQLHSFCFQLVGHRGPVLELIRLRVHDELRFRAIPQVDSVTSQGVRITIRGRGDDLVTQVIHCVAEHRIRVIDFRTELPTLEDVFLKLTGHKIRD